MAALTLVKQVLGKSSELETRVEQLEQENRELRAVLRYVAQHAAMTNNKYHLIPQETRMRVRLQRYRNRNESNGAIIEMVESENGTRLQGWKDLLEAAQANLGSEVVLY